MTGMRDHVVLCYIAGVAGVVLLHFAGLWTWNSWAQLGSLAVVMLVCTRILAPVYFGWREPEDHERG
jgi:membrane protein implicated in regulation of membrane protease activity